VTAPDTPVHDLRIRSLAIAVSQTLSAAVTARDDGALSDPWPWLASMVADHHREHPLSEGDLVLLRRAVCDAYAMDPSTEREAAAALVSRHEEWGLCQLRAACGDEPAPGALAVRAFLTTAELHPLLGRWPAELNPLQADWSAGSGAGDLTDAQVWAQMAEAGAQVLFGRYLEDRDVYTAAIYAQSSGRRRTVHLGVDVVVPSQAPLAAPLDGVIELAEDNAAPQDYGPVVVLRHELPDGHTFFTLYGHLARRTLREVRVGQKIAGGETFAWVGERYENGDWLPHVHVQILVSLVGLGRDVPGVVARDDLPVWKSLSPDPALLLRWPVQRDLPPERDLRAM
jgi:hypothetical protein